MTVLSAPAIETRRAQTRRRELGGFLRSRRHRLAPADAGIVPGPRRRTPGLRREEVAAVAGVSLTWYTWLEQGRVGGVSRQVLDSLARALRLGPDEHRHLLELAGEPAAEPRAPAGASREVRDLLAMVEPNLAHVVTRCFDLVAWNAPVEALFRGMPEWPVPDDPNVVRMMFDVPGMRALYPDWEAEARWLTALLRNEAGRQAGNPRFQRLVDGLNATSPEFREYWSSHDLTPFTPSERRFRHPVLGEVTLRYMKLNVESDPDQSVIVHYAPPASAAAAALARLR
ncbi:helix-turn-helix transcriptional regulator [Actinomadura fibrosa]|uniref:Helix-turn-helix transcriptional regulator n=1 Tax=Actinomadura fibrosa TaxID=111802 RepID=A0ABW2XPJ5_9ACTN|nr:helix-turn-helix transcriptional regulator [Actinomadura fibrosa]